MLLPIRLTYNIYNLHSIINLDIIALKKRRSTVKAILYANYVENIQSSVNLSELEERKLRLNQYWSEYNNVQMQIE